MNLPILISFTSFHIRIPINFLQYRAEDITLREEDERNKALAIYQCIREWKKKKIPSIFLYRTDDNDSML
jgi:hypothetical protein